MRKHRMYKIMSNKNTKRAKIVVIFTVLFAVSIRSLSDIKALDNGQVVQA